MKIVILPSGREDLADGFAFYEHLAPGLGTYYLETLFSDIDSLKLYAGVHRKQCPIRGAFPLPQGSNQHENRLARELKGTNVLLVLNHEVPELKPGAVPQAQPNKLRWCT